MIYSIQSVEVAPGKMQEAVEWCKKFYPYVNRTFGKQTQWMRPVTPGPGQANTIVAITSYDSMAEFGAHADRTGKDAERAALIREAYEENQYFVANTATRTLYVVG
jgi:hypothetical protein